MDAVFGGVILWALFSLAVAFYADNRGRSFGLYFVISLLLSPILGFMIAAVATSEPPAAGPTPAAGSLKKCPDCAEMIQAEARKCRFCGAQFEIGPAVMIEAPPPAIPDRMEPIAPIGYAPVLMVLAGLIFLAFVIALVM